MFRWIEWIRKSVSDFLEDDCLSSGAAIAYYTIFSLPPLLTIALMAATALGFSEEQVNRVIHQEFGVPIAEKADQKKDSSAAKSADKQQDGKDSSATTELPLGLGRLGIVSKIVGLCVLLFSASGVFGQLQYSLDKAWEVEPDPKQGGLWTFLTKRILSLGMVVVLGFLLLVSLVLTAILDEILHVVFGASGGSQIFGIVLNELVSLGLATVLFAGMFKFLPDAKIAWNDVWPGAVITAVLFVIGKTLIGLYLERSQVGADWGASAVSIVGALVWVYYSSLIVLFGAELTQVWATQFGHGMQPAEGAVRVIHEKQRLSPA